MAAAIPFIPLAASAVSLIGGIFTGNKQAKQNEQYIKNQDQQMAQVQQMANSMVSQVSRAEYDSQANKDVNSALQDVFGAMAQRGMGRSTAGLTAAAGASAQIRSSYGQKYLTDRLSALQSAGSMVSGVASTPRMGYDSDPYAAMRSGMVGVSNAAAYYQSNGWPRMGGGTPAPAPTPGYGASYSPAGLGTSGGYYGGSYAGRYNF